MLGLQSDRLSDYEGKELGSREHKWSGLGALTTRVGWWMADARSYAFTPVSTGSLRPVSPKVKQPCVATLEVLAET